jgi:lipopolysaccharide transport system ATP-binding protein
MSIVNSFLEALPLAPSTYSSTLFCSYKDMEVLDFVSDALRFSVDNCAFFESGSSGLPSHCKVLTKTSWTFT